MSHAFRTFPWHLALRMSRPGFLIITVVACVLGMVCAWSQQAATWSTAVAWLTVLLAAMAHAAANAINDYEDALNGADAANTAGLFPFTGGSRLIQNQQVRPLDCLHLAQGLLLSVVLGGAWLVGHSGLGLLWVGLLGMALGWAYSAPPLQLMSRGLGELTVGATWWLMVQGAYFAQSGRFSVMPAAAAWGLSVLVANILLINGLPDAAADAQVGKRTLAVRLGPARAAALYLCLVALAHLGLVLAIWNLWLPMHAAWGLVSLPVAIGAGWELWRWQHRPAALRPAIAGTIAAAALHGLGLAAGLWWAAA